MSQIELPYKDTIRMIIEEIKKHQLMILATSDGDQVTARQMRCIPDGLTIYCITNCYSRKYKQMQENPKVALAVAGLQIEGDASLLGKPLDERNVRFIQVFKEVQPEAYQMNLEKGNIDNPNAELIKIVPKRIALYIPRPSANEPGAYQIILNPVKEKAYKVPWISADQKPLDFSKAPAYRE